MASLEIINLDYDKSKIIQNKLKKFVIDAFVKKKTKNYSLLDISLNKYLYDYKSGHLL